MDLQDTRSWPALAGQRLKETPQSKGVIRIYTGITVGLSILVTVALFFLEGAISDTGGLGSFGHRSLLMTLQTLLPIGLRLAGMCLELGFLAAMLRVSRGQYLSGNTLRLGLDRFWVLLRTKLLQMLVYLGVGIPVIYLAAFAYMMTPWGDDMLQALTPMFLAGELTEELYDGMSQVMEPCVVFCGIVMLLVVLVVSYRYRMVDLLLIDKPGLGARGTLRESRGMMKGNGFRLFRLDLRLWWYYALLGLNLVAAELDLLVPLPWPEKVNYYVAWGLSLVITGLTCRFARGRAEVTYAFAYEALKPKDPQSGVVLGNIFRM